MALQFHAFPACCGAGIITNFIESPETVGETLLNFFSGKPIKARNPWNGHVQEHRYPVHGIEYIMLNELQDKKYNKMLLTIGFQKVVDAAINPNHNSRIHTYVKVKFFGKNGKTTPYQARSSMNDEVKKSLNMTKEEAEAIGEKFSDSFADDLKKIEEERRVRRNRTAQAAANTRALNRARALEAERAGLRVFTKVDGRSAHVAFYLNVVGRG